MDMAQGKSNYRKEAGCHLTARPNMKKKFVSKMFAACLAFAMAAMPIVSMAAPSSGTASGTAGANSSLTNKNLTDHDIINKDVKGSITIHKYDISSAQADGYVFNYSNTDHASGGTDSTLAAGGKRINITSNGKINAAAEEALKEYALKGVEFTYLRVGDVKTFSDVDENGVNGDVELIYGVDADLMGILNLRPYDKANKGKGTVACTLIDGVNYFTSQQINDALKRALEINTYNGTYSTGEAEGTGSTNGAGNRLDHAAGITVKDALESYIKNQGGNHKAGTAMDETNANGVTSKDNLDLGLYLIVETKVPENVVSTVDPWFVQIPMTDLDGEAWFYDISCYPKNQTGHPELDKLVRNAYGTAGLNHNSNGPGAFINGKAVDAGDTYSKDAEIVTNGDTLKNNNYGAWLSDNDKRGDYVYATTNSASEGDLLDFILVTKLPRITSTSTYLTTYELIDTLSDGLRCNDDLKIAIYNSEAYAKVNDTTRALAVWTKQNGGYYDTALQASAGKADGSTTLRIAVTPAGLSQINKNYYDGTHYLVAFYTATVESDATTILGDEGNPNNVSLVWKRTSDGYYNALEDECFVYTYGIDLTKTFSDQNMKAEDYKAVQFTLYNETEDYYVLAAKSQVDGLYYVNGKTVDKKAATKFSPDGAGHLVINGVEGDDYRMSEVHTAKGYSILQNDLAIDITSSKRDIVPSSVHFMSVAADRDEEHPDNNRNLMLSDGTPLATIEEGTTDKTAMAVGRVVPASATVDGTKAAMLSYGSQALGSGLIKAAPNGANAEASANADVKLSILNSKTFVLPQTGGSGLFLITVCGVVLFILGSYYRKDRSSRAA